MMTDEGLIALFEFYVAKLPKPKRLPDEAYSTVFFRLRIGPARSHAAWMATEAIGFVKDAQMTDQYKVISDAALEASRIKLARSKREKAHRWLGFIQGVLWMGGHFTLDELKEHSRKCSDEPDKPETPR